MRRGSKASFFLKTALISTVAFLAPACGDTGGGSATEGAGGSASSGTNTGAMSSGGSGCTPGESTACACENGEMGAQTCKADGSGFNPCECDSPSLCGNGMVEAGEECDDENKQDGDGCSSTCKSELCGNGVQDPGECGPEGTCQPDCSKCGNMMEDPGECGPTGECPADCCLPQNTQIYKGFVDPPSGPVWQYNGLIGTDAGHEMCKAMFAADHACTYEEIKEAETQGELTAIPAGTTAWLHRTTDVIVNGQNSPAGPGGRCNDWKYATNHISDGEYVVFEAGGKGTYFFDNDTVFDANAPGAHTISGQLDCGGQTRAIFCCAQKCEKPPVKP